MDLLKVDIEGKEVLINLDLMIKASFDEASKHLQLKLIDGEVVSINEAEKLWSYLRYVYVTSHPEFNDDKDEVEDIVDGDSTTDDYLSNGFDSFENRLDEVEERIKEKIISNVWEAEKIYNQISMDSWISRQDKQRYKTLLLRAKKAVDDARFVVSVKHIEACQHATLINLGSVKKVVREVIEAQNQLKIDRKLTPELEQKIRVAMERAAWFRAKKKLDEAEVAKAGGSEHKHQKLIEEAKVLLKLDWVEIFSGEQPPEIQI